MDALASRRGFLRDLVGLPLIGGGLTIIGAPIAVAAPATWEMMNEYETWLGFEHQRVATLLRPGQDLKGVRFYGPAHDWHYGRAEREWRNGCPSTRAALVLSAVGCDWRREEGQ